VRNVEFTQEEEDAASSLESTLFYFKCKDRVRSLDGRSLVGSVVRVENRFFVLVAWDTETKVAEVLRSGIAFIERPKRKRPTVGDHVRVIFVPAGSRTRRLVARDGVVAKYMKVGQDDRRPWGVLFTGGRKVYFFPETALMLMNPTGEKCNATLETPGKELPVPNWT
jgi:hypothetical protein